MTEVACDLIMSEILKSLKRFIHGVLTIAALSYRASRSLFFALIAIQVVIGLRPVVAAWVLKRIIDVLALQLQDDMWLTANHTLWILVSLQGLVIASGKFLIDIEHYFRQELKRRLNIITRTMIFDELNRFEGIRYFETPTFHDQVAAASHGLAHAPPQTMIHLSEVVRGAVTVISFVTILTVISPWLATIILLAAVPQILGRLWLSRLNVATFQQRQTKERRRNYLSTLLSTPEAIKDIRAYDLSPYLFKRFIDAMYDVDAINRHNELRQLGIKSGLNILVGLIVSASFGTVIWQAIQGAISVGDVALYFSALIGIMNAFNDMANRLSALNSHVIFFEQYQQLHALPNDLYSSDHPKRVPHLERGITIKDVTFAYRDDLAPILDNFSLTIPAGQTVALVGATGSGKSTLVKLLGRLYEPDSGQILWDDIDLREFSASALREHMSILFQDFAHYHVSARENIGFGDVAAMGDDDAIAAAARRANVHERLAELPQGYDTILSQHIVDEGAGMTLSEGEWQQVGLARVYLRDAEFVILDEPTHDLDRITVQALYDEYFASHKQRTLLVISDHLPILKRVDYIALIKDGAVIEYGTHEDLMAKHGTYAEMMRQRDAL